MNTIYIEITGWTIFLESIKIMAIIAEVLNFIMAMILFINSPPSKDLKPEENIFKIWVMLEMLMIASLVLANIFYVFARTWSRNKISISLSTSDIQDTGVDYLASEDTQMIISMFTVPFWPLFCNVWLEYYNENMKKSSLVETNEELESTISSIFWF